MIGRHGSRMWAAPAGASGTGPAPPSPPTGPPSWFQVPNWSAKKPPGINPNWAQLPTDKRGSRGKDELQFDPNPRTKMVLLHADTAATWIWSRGKPIVILWANSTECILAWVLDSRGSIYGKTRFDHKKAKIVFRRATLHTNSLIANLKTGRGVNSIPF